MRNQLFRQTFGSLLVLLLLPFLSGCELDINNPNAPTDTEVLSTPEGLKAVAIGMQGRYGNAIEETILISGVVSGEIGNTNATPSTTREFQDFPDPGANSQIEDTNGELDALWSKHYGVIKSANDILKNVGSVQLDPGTRSGMEALAKLMKAMSFMALLDNFQQISISPDDADAPPFVDRASALAEVASLLSDAAADTAATTPSAEFNSEIRATSFDMSATILVMQARTALARGNYQEALNFAAAVPAGASAVLVFDAVDANPVNNVIYSLGYYGALASFRGNADAGDMRVDRFTTADSLEGFGGASLNGLSIYADITSSIPVFSADELLLLQAEAYARNNNVNDAETLLGVVRGNNGLSAVSYPDVDAVLEDVFRQRTYSLFLTGQHWADLRRFGKLDQAKVEWLPYPFSERSNNPNTPANPTQ